MSALNSTVVSAVATDGARLSQLGTVLRKKEYLELGITLALIWGLQYCELCDNLVHSCTLRRGQVLVFINRHSPTMNLVKEKQRD